MEFLNTIPGLIVLVYLAAGMIVLNHIDKANPRHTPLLVYISLTICWLPVFLWGFIEAMFRKR
jgi:hypothetical protein